VTGVAAGITGGEVSYRFLDPYGDPLPTGSSLTGEKPGVLSGSSAARRAWPATHGFVGGTTDPDTTTGAVPTGLTQLGARPYDPETGAFTATDPVIDTTHPAQLTGVYAYAWHTPLTATDPAGTEPYPWHNKNPTPAQKAQFKNYNAYGYSDKQKNNVARGLRPNGQGRSSGRPQTAGGQRGWEATANRYEAQVRAHDASSHRARKAFGGFSDSLKGASDTASYVIDREEAKARYYAEMLNKQIRGLAHGVQAAGGVLGGQTATFFRRNGHLISAIQFANKYKRVRAAGGWATIVAGGVLGTGARYGEGEHVSEAILWSSAETLATAAGAGFGLAIGVRIGGIMCAASAVPTAGAGCVAGATTAAVFAVGFGIGADIAASHGISRVQDGWNFHDGIFRDIDHGVAGIFGWESD
jgi:RHS repeat-associated protein